MKFNFCFLPFILLLLIVVSGCDKDDDDNYVPQLPPATQTGENTFGCLLDGEVFLPGNFHNSTNCFYQLVDGEYYFYVKGQNYNSVGDLITISLRTENLPIAEDGRYNLHQVSPGNASGGFLYNLNSDYTSQTNTGELYISKFDFDNNIVSGTFWFDVMDTKGVVHQIREGRFDMQFTQ